MAWLVAAWLVWLAFLLLVWARSEPRLARRGEHEKPRRSLPARADRDAPLSDAPAEDRHAPVHTAREALPVVLVHGFAGFDELGIGAFRHAYFRGVRERLAGAGVDVRTVRLAPLASLRERAAQLAEQVHAMGGGKLHLVAHSMGGLDARLGLARLGLADRVATLVTLGTPHAGTPLAAIVPHLGKLRSLLRGLEDLTPERVRALEEELRDASGVRYASFLLAPRRGARGVCAPLVPTYLWLERQHGASDGLVPTSSQSRGLVLGSLDTDHWGAIGWGAGSTFDASAFYERLGVHLASDEALESFDQPH